MGFDISWYSSFQYCYLKKMQYHAIATYYYIHAVIDLVFYLNPLSITCIIYTPHEGACGESHEGIN